MIDDKRLEEIDMQLEKVERCIRHADSFHEMKRCMQSRYGTVERRR